MTSIQTRSSHIYSRLVSSSPYNMSYIAKIELIDWKIILIAIWQLRNIRDRSKPTVLLKNAHLRKMFHVNLPNPMWINCPLFRRCRWQRRKNITNISAIVMNNGSNAFEKGKDSNWYELQYLSSHTNPNNWQ